MANGFVDLAFGLSMFDKPNRVRLDALPAAETIYQTRQDAPWDYWPAHRMMAEALSVEKGGP